MTLAEAQAALAKVDAAIANDKLQVMFGNRSVMYKSIADLKLARDHFAAVVRSLSTRPKQTVLIARKGF